MQNLFALMRGSIYSAELNNTQRARRSARERERRSDSSNSAQKLLVSKLEIFRSVYVMLKFIIIDNGKAKRSKINENVTYRR